MKDKTWTKKDFTKVYIKDMTDSHLKNTYNMLVRKREENKYIYEEMKRRGFDTPVEMLNFAWDWEEVNDQIYTSFVEGVYVE